MHYYKFNIADYRKDTGHLSVVEHGVYRQLIDWYYLDEKPIPLETQVVSRRLRLGSDLELQALKNVLSDFFQETQKGYVHKRIEVDIKDYHEQVAKNQANGKRGGRPKKTQSVSSGLPDESQNNLNHKPITNNQEPIDIDAYASLSETAFPPCPHQKIISLYGKHLGHLAQPRIWDGDRMAKLRQRWLQAAKPSAFSPTGYKTEADGLAWWDSFFSYIANDTTLSRGFESKGRVWQPDLLWIVTAGNFAKIIDGKYNK